MNSYSLNTNVEKDKSQNVGRVQITKDFICFGKDLEFDFEDYGKSLFFWFSGFYA